MTARTHTHDAAPNTMMQRAVSGAAGGIAGGLVFGVLMQVMGMIPMIAQLTGSSSLAIGWLTHLAISVVLGVAFGLLLGPMARNLGIGALLGLAYGFLWWVLGGLLAMPARMGMPVLELTPTAWQSLVGHLLFGLVLGLVYVMMPRRTG